MWTYGTNHPTIQWSLLLLAALLACCFTRSRKPRWSAGKAAFRKLANRPWLAALLVFAVSLGINGFLTCLKYPEPTIHDEFSYLLASDTFAHGRLTNPVHPHWQHFETFHVLSQPSYMSKYPPGNALFLATGQILCGHPITGVWLAMALAVLAFFWMLRAWTVPQWALLGALLVALNEPVIRAWGQSYWGGSVAFLGGALVFGGVRRIWDSQERPLTRDALLTGLGFVLLANTRPLEGLLVSLPAMISLSVWFFRQHQATWCRKTLRVAMPIAFIGLAGLAGIARYNQAVTGDWASMPYTVHDRTYSASSLIAWKAPPPVPEYHHPRMQRYYLQWGRERQLSLWDRQVYLQQLQRKFVLLLAFLPLGWALALFPAPLIWNDPWWRMAICIFTGVLLVHTQTATSWIFPHYIAPVFALCAAVNVECLRRLRLWQRSRRWGVMAARTSMVMVLLSSIPTALILTCSNNPSPRQQIRTQLAGHEGARHLVILSYGEDYPVGSEWVYNQADIDGSAIVWARDMGQSKNTKLIEYFADRKIWRCHLEIDEGVNLRAVSNGQLYSQDISERSWAK